MYVRIKEFPSNTNKFACSCLYCQKRIKSKLEGYMYFSFANHMYSKWGKYLRGFLYGEIYELFFFSLIGSNTKAVGAEGKGTA